MTPEERKMLEEQYIREEYRSPDYTKREMGGFKIAGLCLAVVIVIAIIYWLLK